MSEDDLGHRRGALPDGVHRARPALGRWTRTVAALACILAGGVLVIRGLVAGDALWLWFGVALVVLGAVGILVARWMFRRGL